MPRLLIASLLVTLLVGCDEEPLDLRAKTDGGGGGAAPLGGGVGPGGGTTPGPGGGVGEACVDAQCPPGTQCVAGECAGDIEPMPDRAAFDAEIIAILDRRCSSLTCHAGPPPREDSAFQIFGSPDHPAFNLTDAEKDENYREFLDFVDFLNPDRSDILTFPLSDPNGTPSHPTNGPVLTQASADYLTIRGWIVAAVTPPPEPDAGPPDAGDDGDGGVGPSGAVPCDALPNTDAPGRPEGWRTRYIEDIDSMVVSSCGEAECHGAPASGGRLWLRGGAAGCDGGWNYLSVQWFIDPGDPIASPLLVKPLMPDHGGREVFAGTEDPRYVALKLWVEDGLVPGQ